MGKKIKNKCCDYKNISDLYMILLDFDVISILVCKQRRQWWLQRDGCFIKIHNKNIYKMKNDSSHKEPQASLRRNNEFNINSLRLNYQACNVYASNFCISIDSTQNTTKESCWLEYEYRQSQVYATCRQQTTASLSSSGRKLMSFLEVLNLSMELLLCLNQARSALDLKSEGP
ncbi:hypothetical protein NC652_024331 [Populus alba x Populus x berolinensis]|nr:hypothetical protein NC652_024331 [Populus alba x Populus x berolinensis]